MKYLTLLFLLALNSYAAVCSPSDISCTVPGEGQNCSFNTIINDCPSICPDGWTCNITGICYDVEIVPLLIYSTKCEIYNFQESPCENGTYRYKEQSISYNGLLGFNPPADQQYVNLEDEYRNCTYNYTKYGFGTGQAEFNQAMIIFIDFIVIIFLLVCVYAFTPNSKTH